MTDVFVPHGYVSKSFWPKRAGENIEDVPKKRIKENHLVQIQPFQVYQLDQPHVIRKRYGHLGASPRCRASVSESMDLVRKVLQPAINSDIVNALKQYITVFRQAAENTCENMRTEPFSAFCSPSELDIEHMVYKACCDALDHSKTLFDKRKNKHKDMKSELHFQNTMTKQLLSAPQAPVASSLPDHLISMKRVPSPDFPWSKRLVKGSPRRSLSPVSKKRGKAIPGGKRYGSPSRSNKELLRHDDWDPDKLTVDTKFVMGTRANRALGLGTTRGRIYMKHPDLFKYSSDPEDKKWMVKNNCMAATGGKNTFIMIAEDIYSLLENEYKDSPGLIPEEMRVFSLPEFILQKMRSIMVREKKLAQKFAEKTASPSVARIAENHSKSDSPKKFSPACSPKLNVKAIKTEPMISQHHPKRHAAEKAAVAIIASSSASNGESEMEARTGKHSVSLPRSNSSSSSDESSDSDSSADDDQ